MPYDQDGNWIDEDTHLSPWERAHGNKPYDPNDADANKRNDFDDWVDEIYKDTTPDTDWSQRTDPWAPGQEIDLYNPPARPPGPPSPPPSAPGPTIPPPGGGGGRSGRSSDYNRRTEATQRPIAEKGFQSMDEIMSYLKRLFPDGAFNKDIVARRTEGARENLESFRKSRSASNRAMLAARGLLSEGEGHESGPEYTMVENMEDDIADRYSQAVSQIYADEGRAADQRMMQALSLATGMSSDQARMLIDQFRANTEHDLGFGRLDLDWAGHDLDVDRLDLDRQLGFGNLALGNMRGVNDYNLGLGRLGLDRELGLAALDNADVDRLIRLIEQLLAGANIGAGGYR